jgi:hypothetical protein
MTLKDHDLGTPRPRTTSRDQVLQTVELTIDGQTISVEEGTSVMCLKIGASQVKICQQIFGVSQTVFCEADKIELAIRNVLKKIRKSIP